MLITNENVFFKVLTVFKAFSEVISIPENTLNKFTKEDGFGFK